MIKDKLTEAVEAGLNSIRNGDDHIPLNMRGELEVTVKDRDGNVISYERGHNQVTDLAKMAIIHLLAGEIGVVDSDIFSVPGETRTYYISSQAPMPENYAKINSSFVPENHTVSQNLDGVLVSDEQYFYDGGKYVTETSSINQLSQTMPRDVGGFPLKFNFPTKMLFGTGLEAYDDASAETDYNKEIGSGSLNVQAINKLNGYTTSDPGFNTNFWKGLDLSDDISAVGTIGERLTNWYANEKFRARTLQSSTPFKIDTPISSTATSIRGAIKNCYITRTDGQTARYNGATKMAQPDYRGYGYPCFIYAKRSTQRFYWNTEGNNETYYKMNNALGTTSPYETELVYTVIMPAQPVNSTEITTFYPYNGWVLKQAGLFSDSRYKLRSEDGDESSPYKEASLLEVANAGSDDGKIYRDSVGGQLLFTRNLSSPILKTPDNQVVFNWHIFITV